MIHLWPRPGPILTDNYIFVLFTDRGSTGGNRRRSSSRNRREARHRWGGGHDILYIYTDLYIFKTRTESGLALHWGEGGATQARGAAEAGSAASWARHWEHRQRGWGEDAQLSRQALIRGVQAAPQTERRQQEFVQTISLSALSSFKGTEALKKPTIQSLTHILQKCIWKRPGFVKSQIKTVLRVWSPLEWVISGPVASLPRAHLSVHRIWPWPQQNCPWQWQSQQSQWEDRSQGREPWFRQISQSSTKKILLQGGKRWELRSDGSQGNNINCVLHFSSVWNREFRSL